MKSQVKKEIEIPSGVTVNVNDGNLHVKGSKGENTRDFSYPGINIGVEGQKINLVCEAASKRESRMISTFMAHIKNMIRGVEIPFEYKLKICSGHFPMNVAVSGKEFVVKNFLGEKHPRRIVIEEGVTVKIAGTEVSVNSVSREKAGMVTARIEQMCRITNKDRRIFQDGIYITRKPQRIL